MDTINRASGMLRKPRQRGLDQPTTHVSNGLDTSNTDSEKCSKMAGAGDDSSSGDGTLASYAWKWEGSAVALLKKVQLSLLTIWRSSMWLL